MKHQPLESYYNQASERLTFRPFVEEDFVRWEPFFINNPTLEYLGATMFMNLTPLEKSTKWLGKQIDRQNKGEFGQLAVIDKSTGEFIGVGGVIYREIDGIDEYEITYSLFPKAWGKGLGTELAIHFKEYLKNTLRLSSVISIIHVDNEASINVAKKNEMVLDSEFEFLEMPVAMFRATF